MKRDTFISVQKWPIIFLVKLTIVSSLDYEEGILSYMRRDGLSIEI